MQTKNISQVINFKATPDKVYKALMSSAQLSKITKEPAKIGTKVGDLFSAYSGYITGFNLVLVKNKRIVQALHASDWPKNHYSIVDFEFTKTKTGTELKFNHYAVPQGQYKSIAAGWKEYYWQPMQDLL